MSRTGAYIMSLAVALAALPLAAAAPETSLRPQDRGDRPILIRYSSGGSLLAPAIDHPSSGATGLTEPANRDHCIG